MDDRDMKSVSTKQLSIANTAKKYRHEPITVLHPNLDLHWLWEASLRVRKNSASGVDGQTYAEYEDGSYRAPPVKRRYIPKDGGEKRGIGIPTLEDKILQRAVVMLLEPIYEEEFHDFSFGFRPGKSPHQALQYIYNQSSQKGSSQKGVIPWSSQKGVIPWISTNRLPPASSPRSPEAISFPN